MDELEKDNKNNTKLYRQIKQQKEKNETTSISKKQWQDYLENTHIEKEYTRRNHKKLVKEVNNIINYIKTESRQDQITSVTN